MAGFPLAALALPLYVTLPTFYAERFGLSLASIGAALLAIRLFDAVNDPVIGWLADRFPSNRRRTTWVLWASLPLCAACLTLFWPPSSAGILTLLLAGLFLTIAQTAYSLPYFALGAELSDDTDERSRIAATREAFVLVGTLVATVIPVAIGWGNTVAMHGMAWMAIIVATTLILATAAMLFAGEKLLVAPSKKHDRPSPLTVLSNRHFRALLPAYFLNALANAFPATLFLLFVSERLQAPDQRGLLLGGYFACALAGIAIWTPLSARFGKVRTWRFAMLVAVASFVPVAFLGPGDFVAFAAICALSGFCLGADLVLPASMQADVIESDQRQHGGDSRGGQFFAIWGLATKVALALAAGIAFPVLQWSGFTVGATTGIAGLATLGLLYGLAPVVLKLAAIAFSLGYRLDPRLTPVNPATIRK